MKISFMFEYSIWMQVFKAKRCAKENVQTYKP